MKTILITGVAGFIGSNLAKRLLDEGYKVIGIDNLSSGLIEQIPDGVKFFKGDIREMYFYPIVKGVDCIFHLAAKNCISDCQSNPRETFDINVNGAVNLMEAARIHKVTKVIYAESSAIYEGSDIYPTPESEIKPESFYALSKVGTKLVMDGYAKNHGIITTALRYFCVYGPHQDYRRSIPPLFSSFIIKLLNGETPIIYGDGSKKRDFVYVDDINDFHVKCIEDNRTDNETFNLGCGQNYSVNEIYKIITDKLNIKDITPKYKENLPGETFQNLADITKAKKLGWYPRTSIEDGLQNTIQYILTQLNLNKI
jgi:UDP-glucose 4-epimerase